IPSAPNPSLPRNHAHTTDAARTNPREITAPATDQNAPITNRSRSVRSCFCPRDAPTTQVCNRVLMRGLLREGRNRPSPRRRNVPAHRTTPQIASGSFAAPQSPKTPPTAHSTPEPAAHNAHTDAAARHDSLPDTPESLRCLPQAPESDVH